MNRERKFKLITIFIGISLSLFVTEMTARIYLFGSDAFSFAKMNSLSEIGGSGLVNAAESNDVLYELKPNINTYFKTAAFKTNSLNLRDKEYSLKKESNVIRGAFVGDSFTMGSCIEIEDTYHSKLETSLNEQSNLHQYEFINFGVGGYNLLNYLGVLENKILQFSPDFIVIGYCASNDFRIPNKKHHEGNYKVKPKSNNRFFTPYFVRLFYFAFFSKKERKKDIITDKNKIFMNDMFEKYKRFGQQNNLPIIINYLSNKPVNKDVDIVRELVLQNGLYFLDSSEKFKGTNYIDYRATTLDRHPNAVANDLFASSLLSFKPFQKMISPLDN